MSRTYRRSFTIDESGQVKYVKGHLNIYNCYTLPWLYRSQEQLTQEAIDEYARATRDGHLSETSLRTGFKKEATIFLRRQNKRYCDAVLRGEDVDDLPYPVRREGKKFFWNWW